MRRITELRAKIIELEDARRKGPDEFTRKLITTQIVTLKWVLEEE